MQTIDPVPGPRPFHARSARDFGVAVKYFRNLAGLTQAELDARAGIHRTYHSELERGHATEAMERIMYLLNELGVRVSLAREER